MNLGVFDMIGLAASLVFAIPLANYAVIQLLAGQTALGAGLLVVAIAMVVLPQYFLDPGRILAGFAKGLLPRQLRGGDSTEDATVVDSEPPADGSESTADDSTVEAEPADVTDAIDEAEPAEQ